MLEAEPSESSRKIDVLTVVAVAITVGLACCFLHEAVGHSGMAKILSVKVTRFTNAYASQRDATPTQERIIAAAGIPVTMLLGVMAILYAGTLRRKQHNVMDYFLWLFGFVNVLNGANYMLMLAFVKTGDVHGVVHGLPYETVWRLVIMIVGLITMLAMFYFGLKSLLPFVGGKADVRRRTAALTVVPYFVIGTVNVGTALWFATGKLPLWLLLLSAGGSTFGSNMALLWLNFVRRSEVTPSLTLTRSYGWYVTGGVCLGLYCLLARGIDF